jgi:hypothetical protein
MGPARTVALCSEHWDTLCDDKQLAYRKLGLALKPQLPADTGFAQVSALVKGLAQVSRLPGS